MRVVKLGESGRREFVIEQLLGFIRSNELSPGSRLPPEPALSEMFGVSRTVVREAMQSLQAMGTIRIEQGRGTFVAENPLAQPFKVWASMNAHRVDELFDVRIILESESASRAASNRPDEHIETIAEILDEARESVERTDWLGALKADVKFHRAITQAAGLPLLEEMLGVTLLTWVQLTSNAANEKNKAERLQLVLGEHTDVFDAVRSGQSDAARIAMRTHLDNSRQRRLRNDGVTKQA